MQKYCQIIISARDKKEANVISDVLIKNRLAAGTLITNGPSRYWWNGKIVEKIYYNVSVFSLLRLKKDIIREVKKVHSDKCPIIAIHNISGNTEFLKWIEQETIGN